MMQKAFIVLNFMKKPKYIIVQDGEPIRTASEIPLELFKKEYLSYLWIIRLKDLHYWYLNEWLPLPSLEIQQNKLF